MAILKTKQGDIDVRIKRSPDDTYCDEYIKVEGKGKHSDDSRERDIISEPGTMYYVDVTLKHGFYFGEYQGIDANLSFPGRTEIVSETSFWKPISCLKIKTDISRNIEYADVGVGGQGQETHENRRMASPPHTQNTANVEIIKDEPIDLDDDDDYIIIVSATNNPILSPAARKVETNLLDGELLKKKAALEELNEEIAQGKRLLKMKRDRDALQVEIDAAKCKKRVKTE